MWEPLLAPGLGLLSGTRRDLRGFAQELTHFTLHTRAESILWCDGDHGFDPYDFAERNMLAGHSADEGADRVLIKRCMTPFQWDTVLTKHLDEKLSMTDASVVLAVPFDRLFSTDELKDWEQEDYVRFAVRHLRGLAKRFRVPIVIAVDMARWWQSHPILAQATYEGADARWHIDRPDGRWRATGKDVIDPYLRQQVTLLDYAEVDTVVSPRPPRRSHVLRTLA